MTTLLLEMAIVPYFNLKNLVLIFLPFLLLIKDGFVLGNGCLLKGDKSSVYISIAENRTRGSLLTTLPLLGKTAENGSGEIDLRLVKGSEFASLNALQKKLLLKKAVDRDSGTSKFEVVVECTPIPKNKQLKVNISTFVTVTDVNDNAPQFAESEFFIELPEELPIGTAVALDFRAVDKDQDGPNNFITYSLIPNQKKGTQQQPLLTIPDPHTPQLVIGKRVDYETIQSFVLDIQARDSGRPSLKSQTRVRVQVVDVDDLNPYFEHHIYSADSIVDSIVQVQPLPILAKDSDTFHQPIVYSISGDDSHQFSIEEKTGVVGYSGSPSFLPSSTALVVHASQVNRPERNASAVLVITNINASSFSSVVNQQQSQHSVYFIQLPSNCPKGRRIFQLPVRNSTYQLLEASRLPFSMSQDGVLTVIGVLHKPEYHLAVEVDDGGSQQKIEVNVMVYPSLVTGPEFGEQEYVFELDPLEAMLGRVQAHSYANQLGDESLFYTLLNANEDFEIDAEGVLTTRKQPKEKRYTAEIIQELIGMVEDVQGRRNFVRILIKSPPNNSKYRISFWGLLCFVSILANLVVFTMVCGKKIVEIYQSKRGCSIGSEWMGGCPPGVTITSPISTSDIDDFASCYRINKF